MSTSRNLTGLLVFAGGCLGAWARAATTVIFSFFKTEDVVSANSQSAANPWWLERLTHPVMGWDIVTVNLLGAFILGLLTVYLVERSQAGWKSLLGTGFCGAFTTYSTMIASLQYGLFALVECLVLLLVGLGLGTVAMNWFGPRLPKEVSA